MLYSITSNNLEKKQVTMKPTKLEFQSQLKNCKMKFSLNPPPPQWSVTFEPPLTIFQYIDYQCFII